MIYVACSDVDYRGPRQSETSRCDGVCICVYACMSCIYLDTGRCNSGMVSARMQQVMFDDDDRVCQYPSISVIRSVVVSRKANGRCTEKGSGLDSKSYGYHCLSVCLFAY